MAYKDWNEVFADPMFADASPEKQDWVLSQVDPNKSIEDRTKVLGMYRKGQEKINAEADEIKKGWMERATNIYRQGAQMAAGGVGRGIETVTEPLVTGQRLLNRDEPIGQIMGGTSPSGGFPRATAHPPTAQRVGEGVILQEPWQAGAIAGSLAIPGISAIGPIAKGAPALSKFMSSGKALPRVIGATAGGEMGGQVSGLQTGEGGLKGGLAQSAGEVLGKLVGVARRSAPGKATRIADEESARVGDVFKTIVPEFGAATGPQKGASQRLGEFFAGSNRAQKSSEAMFGKRIDEIQNMLDVTGDPYIRSPLLIEAYKILTKSAKSDPALVRQLKQLEPAPGPQGGFRIDQAAKILALRRDRLSHPANPNATAHETGQVIDELAGDIEAAISNRLSGVGGGMFAQAREGVAKSHGLRDILAKGFPEGKGGYELNMLALQKAMSDPTLASRFTPDEIAALNYAFTRGAQRVPGFRDTGAIKEHFLPFTPTGGVVLALRNLLGRVQYQGRKPLSVDPSTKAGMGLAGLVGIPPYLRDKEE